MSSTAFLLLHICLILIKYYVLSTEDFLDFDIKDDFDVLLLECRKFLSNFWILWLKSMDCKTIFFLYPDTLKRERKKKKKKTLLKEFKAELEQWLICFQPHQSFFWGWCVEKAVTDPWLLREKIWEKTHNKNNGQFCT